MKTLNCVVAFVLVAFVGSVGPVPAHAEEGVSAVVPAHAEEGVQGRCDARLVSHRISLEAPRRGNRRGNHRTWWLYTTWDASTDEDTVRVVWSYSYSVSHIIRGFNRRDTSRGRDNMVHTVGYNDTERVRRRTSMPVASGDTSVSVTNVSVDEVSCTGRLPGTGLRTGTGIEAGFTSRGAARRRAH